MATRNVNGIEWFYEERGNGPAVVLLHAFPMDSGMYRAQLDELSKDFRVICPDLPGFGRTKHDAPFTVKWQAEQVAALLREIGVTPAVVGGCSMGGYIALAMAREFPTDLRGLILIDTKAEGDTAEGRQNRDRLIEMVQKHGAQAVADAMVPKMLGAATKAKLEAGVREVAMRTSPTTLTNALAALRDRPDRTEFLPSVAVPTLILVGQEDQITPPGVAEGMRKAIRQSTLKVIAGAGHLTPLEVPAEVNAAIRGFVAQLISCETG